MNELTEILKNLDWSPLWISLKTGIVATVLSFFLGIFAARRSIRKGPGARSVLDGILTLPMVLPPTATGFFLLLFFSKRRPFGSFLYQQFGLKVVQSWLGCIIAATVIAFPLMYRNARAAFEQMDVNLVYAGRTLGMSETKIFWKVVMPASGPGIIAGTYSRKDGDGFTADRHGASGRRLPDSRDLGCCGTADCLCCDFPDELCGGKEDEEPEKMVSFALPEVSAENIHTDRQRKRERQK